MFVRTYSAEVNEANVRIARQNNGDDIFSDAVRREKRRSWRCIQILQLRFG